MTNLVGTGISRLRAGWQHLVVAAGLGLLLGAIAWYASPWLALLAIAAAYAAAIMLRRPELGLLTIVLLTSTIVWVDRLPMLPIGIGSLLTPDVVLVFLFGFLVVRWLADPAYTLRRTPLDGALIAFYAVALVATFAGLQAGTTAPTAAQRELRTVTYYLVFFLVTNLVRTRAQLRLLIEGLLALAAIVAIVMVVQYQVGPGLKLFPYRVETLTGPYDTVSRLLPPGQSLIIVGFVTLVVMLVLDPKQARSPLRLAQTALVSLALVMTFNRNFWVGAGIALTLLALLGRSQDRQRLIGGALAVALLGAVILAPILAGPQSEIKALLQASAARLSTLGTLQTLQEGSLRFRFVEYSWAFPSVAAHPFLGVGLGGTYRPWDPRLDWVLFDGRDYIHNGHMWIILKTGLLGYACFACLVIVFLARGLRSWRRVADPFLRAIALAFVLALASCLVAALVNPIFGDWYWVPVLSMMMGINELIFQTAPAGAPATANQAPAVAPSAQPGRGNDWQSA